MNPFTIFIKTLSITNKPIKMSASKSLYDIKINSLQGKSIDLLSFKGKKVLFVNVASKCGFTPQYKDLQKLHDEYQDSLIVIGVPTNDFKQEPGSNKEIKDFCETTFGINFPITEKMNVIGKNSHPFYLWAKKNYGRSAIPKWNFHKIIIGRDGKVADTFASITKPLSNKFIKIIDQELKN